MEFQGYQYEARRGDDERTLLVSQPTTTEPERVSQPKELSSVDEEQRSQWHPWNCTPAGRSRPVLALRRSLAPKLDYDRIARSGSRDWF